MSRHVANGRSAELALNIWCGGPAKEMRCAADIRRDGPTRVALNIDDVCMCMCACVIYEMSLVCAVCGDLDRC